MSINYLKDVHMRRKRLNMRKWGGGEGCLKEKKEGFLRLLWKNKFCQSGNNVLFSSLLLSCNYYVSNKQDCTVKGFHDSTPYFTSDLSLCQPDQHQDESL